MNEAYPTLSALLAGGYGRREARLVEVLVRREGLHRALNHPAVYSWFIGRMMKTAFPLSRARSKRLEERFSLAIRGERGLARRPTQYIKAYRNADVALRSRENEIGEFEARAEVVEGRPRSQRNGERLFSRQTALAALAALRAGVTRQTFLKGLAQERKKK